MNGIFLGTLIFCLLEAVKGYTQHISEEELREEISNLSINQEFYLKSKFPIDTKIIYYGSTVRFQHVPTKFNLHSHDLRYGSGSFQQSITAVSFTNDYNSLWSIKNAHDQPLRHFTEIIKCGDVVRLEHILTGKNLHSHDFITGISKKYEVSGFGDNGNGDAGDDWQIICESQPEGSSLMGNTVFDLKHVMTSRYLYTETGCMFNHQNCGHNCPTSGQLEMAAEVHPSAFTKWRINTGFFFIIGPDDEEISSNTCYNGQCEELETEAEKRRPGGEL